MTDNVSALRQQLQQLETQRRDGKIGKRDYERQRAALERSILDQVLEQPATGAVPAAPRPSTRLVAGVAALVLLIAAGGYSVTGSPELISGVPTEASAGMDANHSLSPEEFNAAVDRLAEKLKAEPDNGEGWSMLARSYVHLGRFADALPAFVKALEIQGDDPRLLTDYADALAVTRDRNLDGEPTKLIDRALKMDPDNLKALALAGTAAFNRKDFPAAVRHWERMLQLSPADSAFMPQLKDSIAEARRLAAAAPAAAAPQQPAAPVVATQQGPAAAAAPGDAGAAAAGGGTLTGTVKLAPSLKAAPEDTVFLLARPAEGSRMPLAVLRRQVKDLPFQFTLDDSLAMSPGTRLSLHPQVIVEARVSKSGQAQAAAGDFVARTAPIANNSRGVVLEIADVVK